VTAGGGGDFAAVSSEVGASSGARASGAEELVDPCDAIDTWGVSDMAGESNRAADATARVLEGAVFPVILDLPRIKSDGAPCAFNGLAHRKLSMGSHGPDDPKRDDGRSARVAVSGIAEMLVAKPVHFGQVS
jgi:hypothetical protein